MVVVNALKGVGLLVDQTDDPPPASIMQAVAGFHDDAIADVRQGAAALLRRIERIGIEPAESLVPEPAVP